MDAAREGGRGEEDKVEWEVNKYDTGRGRKQTWIWLCFFLNKLGMEQYECVSLFLACPSLPNGFFPIFLDLNIN